MDDRTTDSHNGRIERYLTESGLSVRHPRVVPLTGDASDRRYFRVLLDDGPSIVLALHAGPIEFATLPFANVATLLEQMPSAGAGDSGPLRRSSASSLCRISATSRCRRTSAPRSADRARRAVPRGGSAHRNAAAPRRRSCSPSDSSLIGIAFDVEKLTWELEFFVKHFLQAYRGAPLSDDERQALARSGRRSPGNWPLSPGAVPSRLPQPEPDVARRPSVSSSIFRMRGWVRTPTIWYRCCAIPTWT